MIKPPKQLIIAFIILYVYAFGWWIIEAANPGITTKIIGGAPAPAWYCCFGGLYIVNLFVAWLVGTV